MDDPLLVRRFKGFRDLPRNAQGLVERDGAPRQPLRQILALHEFQYEGLDAGSVLQPKWPRCADDSARRGLSLRAGTSPLVPRLPRTPRAGS